MMECCHIQQRNTAVEMNYSEMQSMDESSNRNCTAKSKNQKIRVWSNFYNSIKTLE